MKRRKKFLIASALAMIMLISGCAKIQTSETAQNMKNSGSGENAITESSSITPSDKIMQLESGLSAVRYDGDYGFDAFIEQGGASSDSEVINFLSENFLSGASLNFSAEAFGCSTISVKSLEGDALFGRNFDWENCEAMVVASRPENGYASISTVNMDFITQGAGGGVVGMALKMDAVRTIAALYAPLDGMNEKGLVVSVNMIQDSATIEQTTNKPDITTTTVIRLLLNQASNVEEALELLEQYDMHASMGMMVHFAMADTTGRSVVVEYVNDQMIVTETPAVTNFYFAEGEKKDIGTAQSHERFDILIDLLEEAQTMDMNDVRQALDSVSKDGFDEFASTEWSIVFNQSTGEIQYFHRENYKKKYIFSVK